MNTGMPRQQPPPIDPADVAGDDRRIPLQRLRQALAVEGENPILLRALAEQLLVENRFAEAVASLERALALAPHEALTWFLMGAAREGMGNGEQAVDHYRQCCRLAPDWAEAWFHLGVRRLQLDRFAEAVDALNRAVALQPAWAAAWLNLGSALDGDGRAQEALSAWRHAATLDDRDALAHYNCGRHYQAAGDLDRAAAAYARAVQRAPGMVVAYIDLGICQQMLGNLETAQTCFSQAVAQAPDNAQGWRHLADALLAHERFGEAIEALHRALALAPDNAETHFKLAGVLCRRWQIDEAIAHCRKAVAIRPDDAMAKAALYELARHGCQWQLAGQLATELDHLTANQLSRGEKTTEWPLLSLWRHDDPQRNLAVAASWSRVEENRYRAAQDRPRFQHRPGQRSRPIRIGYLSGDFRAHAVAHQIRGLFRRHDRNRFEIHGYATNPGDGSDYREQLIQACDHFTAIDHLEGRRAAETINRDGIDILVDLTGYTMGARLDILSLRPAPVQISYLGFLGSTGSSCVDYFITDHVVTPAGHETGFTEKLIYMPHCYQVNDDTMAIAAQSFDRREMGLPPEAVVFCCFNQPFKIDRATFDAWLEILRQVPGSVLWLLDHNRAARDQLCLEARNAGIDPARLIFSAPIRIDLHLARLQLADLALDTFSYNGGATTANALWAGVPLVSLMGNHLVSRMSASALMAAGLPELVARTPGDYCRLAIELGTAAEKRSLLRQKLARNRRTAPLFDTRLFARHLERAYETVMDRFDKGLPPKAFDVDPIADPPAPGRAPISPASRPLAIAAAPAPQMDLGEMAQAAQAAIQRDDLPAAADIYQRMLALAPRSAEIHHLLGLVHAEQQQWAEARREFARAIELDGDNAAFHHELGNALQALEAFPGAVAAYRQALQLRPDDTDSWINLGNALYKGGDRETARHCYERALQQSPDSAVAMNNLGKSHYDLRDIDSAMHWYDKALQIDPEYAEAHFNRAAALLLRGDYENGWPEYEWRFRRRQASNVYPHPLKGPRWDGRPYPGARLLVHGEQGLGDVIQFARFLPRAKALGGTLLLEAQAPLIPFLSTMTCVDRIVPFSPKHPPAVPYDLHISLQSLPRLFGTTLSRLPANVPYLHADPAKAAHWRQRLAGPGPCVGLVWSCSDMSSYRESHLEFMRPLLAIPEVRWFSLQKGPGAGQLAALPQDLELGRLGEALGDFGDTAAVVAGLDLLITVDTAVAHVAGAMNVPVWVLLPFAGDWRWLLHPSQTPWYPSARLFRQTRPGDWDGVVSRVRAALLGRVPFSTGDPISGGKGGTPCESR